MVFIFPLEGRRVKQRGNITSRNVDTYGISIRDSSHMLVQSTTDYIEKYFWEHQFGKAEVYIVNWSWF